MVVLPTRLCWTTDAHVDRVSIRLHRVITARLKT
jgi:hypothetical protein